jgi:hypothetical protein
MKLMKNPLGPATLGFSVLGFPVFPTISTVAVGLLNTGKYDKSERTVGDCTRQEHFDPDL